MRNTDLQLTEQNAPAARSKRRTEIEGLRTVAALLVAVYHIWVGKVSGGVDVFFVVTGFFITLTVLKHVDAGRIRPFAYFGRLFRRLLPGASAVLVFAGLITLLWAPAPLMERNFEEIIASSLSFENLYLAFNAVDYLNAEDPQTPVQHFWAMSIQAQFYVLWLLLAALVLLIVKLTAANARKTMAIALCVIFVISMALSIWQTATVQPFAYFVPWTRMWEFAAGGLLALAGSRLHLKGVAAGIASIASVVVLVLTGALLPVQGGFPGVIAAVPVAAAALIIISTREDERWWAGTRILSLKPFVWLGSIAFGIYLWHWPLLVLYRYWYGLDARPGVLAGSAMIIGAIVLAYLTKLLLENPVQNGWPKSPSLRPVIATGLVVAWVAAVAAPVGWIASVALSPHDSPTEQAAECSGYRALAEGVEECSAALEGGPLVPPRAEVRGDIGNAYECYTSADETRLEECDVFGGAGTRVAVVGNSHAAMLTPDFRTMADERGWELTLLTGNGCVWTAVPENDDCGERIAQQEALLIDDPFDVVIVVGAASKEGERDAREYIDAQFDRLIAAGSTVVVIEDNPRLSEEQRNCLQSVGDAELASGVCDISAADGYDYIDQYWDVASARDDIVMVPTRDFYCYDGTCPMVIGNVVVYRDGHHLTLTYIDSMFEELMARIDQRTDALQ